MSQEALILEEIQTLVKENKELKIKLSAISRCYSSICATLHLVLKLYNDDHDSPAWKECSNSVCQSNLSVLTKLNLS